MIESGTKVRCKPQFGRHVEGCVISYLNGLYLVDCGEYDETFPANRVKEIKEKESA